MLVERFVIGVEIVIRVVMLKEVEIRNGGGDDGDGDGDGDGVVAIR